MGGGPPCGSEELRCWSWITGRQGDRTRFLTDAVHLVGVWADRSPLHRVIVNEEKRVKKIMK